MHEPDGAGEGRHEPGDDRALLGEGLGETRGQERDAGAAEHERRNRLPLGGLHRDLRLHPGGRERPVEQVAGREAPRGHDQRQLAQAGDREPARRGQARAGRADRDDLLPLERDRDELLPAGRQLGQPELAPSVEHHRVDRDEVVGRRDADRDARMGVAEPPDEAAQRIGGEGRQRHEVEGAGVEAADAGDGGEHRVAVAGQLAGGSDECPARIGQLDRAPEPVEQAHRELGLEPPDPVGERRLAHVQRGGRPREAAVVHDREHVVDLSELHRQHL